MTLKAKFRRFLDKYHQGYYIEQYVINDGQKHPVAVICPGGGYHWVCSFSEGMPYAKKLNRMGYSAFVYITTAGKARSIPYRIGILREQLQKLRNTGISGTLI